MKKGLVLEGGAMRGMFTAGVIDVLMENNIEFDGAIGVSAGAVFGCNYKSKQSGRVIRYNTAYCRDSRFCSLSSLIRTGDLFGAEFCYNELPQKLDVFDTETYQKNPMEFFVVSTNIETGKAVYTRCDRGEKEDLEWFRASASMPLVSRIVEIDNLKLLDGGIADPIPLKYFESIGYKQNIVVLTQPSDYIKTPSKAIPLLKTILRKYPELIKAMTERHKVYNSDIEYVQTKENNGEILVIRPKEPLPVGRIEHNPKKLYTAYEQGRIEAESKLEKIKEFLFTAQ